MTDPTAITPGVDALMPGDPNLVCGPSHGPESPLGAANRRGEIVAADVHVAAALGRLAGEDDAAVLMVVAETVAAARAGSSCHHVVDPAVLERLRHSPLVDTGPDPDTTPSGAGRPLRLVEDLLYLDRFWRDERRVAQQILARSTIDPRVDVAALRESLGADRFSPAVPDRQRVATALAVLRGFSVIAGGPGTGKTTTVAKVMAALLEQPGPPARIALAAPTGKAAARLQSAIAEQMDSLGIQQQLQASTIHRLLGHRPGSAPRHHAGNPLPHDVVIIDETSMVSLPLLAKVLDAVRPDARLILLGDPDQLASVEVGAVLADLVSRPAGPQLDPRWEQVVAADLAADVPQVREDAARSVVRLSRGFRNNQDIADLATAIQRGDGPGALRILYDPGVASVRLIEIDATADPASDPELASLRDRCVQQALAVARAAHQGDAGAALSELIRHQILTAHRTGPSGAARWSAAVHRAAARIDPRLVAGGAGDPAWYVGRPIIITRNDDDTGLSNGDVGVAVVQPQPDGQPGLVVAFDVGDGVRFHPGRLPEHLPLQAITVHRAQGSQYDAVTVVLPEPGSALLTRELLYTAVTRARQEVTILGHPDAVVAAVERQAGRASGLRRSGAW